ncbi:MAG: sensor domain-containing diguanylate cyclase [Candidatus Brocadiaceae bacterium]|nr:sensor domain-containing diguanylate cyclase [Candidatus Brocadiaceae bacterium]
MGNLICLSERPATQRIVFLKKANERLFGEFKEQKRRETALCGSEERYRSIIDNVLESPNIGTIILDTDVTNLKETEKAFKESEMLFKTIFNGAVDGILIIDPKTRKLLLGNKSMCKILDVTEEEIKTLEMKDIYREDDLPDVMDQLKNQLKQGHAHAADIPIKRKDGSIFYADIAISQITLDGKCYFLCISRDISNRKQSEEKIRHMAFHDPLTKLPNRMLFHDRLSLALTHAHRNKKMLSVLFLDLDKFKTINDTLGHHIGDELLRNVADRLHMCIREGDTIARLGGDEFLILLPGITRAGDVSNVARKIINAFKQPCIIDNHKIIITISIGIALYPNDGNNAETLLKNADESMYQAKESGRNNYKFHNHIMQSQLIEKNKNGTRSLLCGG